MQNTCYYFYRLCLVHVRSYLKKKVASYSCEQMSCDIFIYKNNELIFHSLTPVAYDFRSEKKEDIITIGGDHYEIKIKKDGYQTIKQAIPKIQDKHFYLIKE